MSAPAPSLWILAAHPVAHGAEERAGFAELVRERVGGARAAGLLVTCHRVELYGTGDAGELEELEAAARQRGLARLGMYRDRAALRHLLRLAAGLESAVTGEDEVLHQVRELLERVRGTEPPDHALVRALEVAVGVGRRARAERPRPVDRSLADRAFNWILERGGQIHGSRVVVAGAGAMGRALAAGAARRGAMVTVVSRNPGRARDVALAVGGSWTGLGDGVGAVRGAEALLVALSGPWTSLSDGWPPTGGARRGGEDALPLVVDLSSPAAVPEPVRASLDGRFIGIDQLFVRPDVAGEAEELRRAYREHAGQLVEAACDAYASWAAARTSVETLRALRQAAEDQRARDLERLFRRLPALDERERRAVGAFSEQLVARLLHRPLARLHDDVDGSAAEAARMLFDL